MSVKPIRPDEVAEEKLNTLPESVIEVFNDLIAENWDGKSSHVLQRDVVDRIKRKMETNHFKTSWLDVEDIYRRAGWDVEYDKPGYNESYDASFTFTKKHE
jgi:hypothetical protein